MALLAGGLVGVAAPAQADGHGEDRCTNRSYGVEYTEETAKAQAALDAPSSCDWSDVLFYSHYVFGQKSDGRFYFQSYGSPDKPEPPTAQECEDKGQVLDGNECRDKTAEETCEESDEHWYDNSCNEKSPKENECLLEGDVWEDGKCLPWEEMVDIGFPGVGALEGADGEFYTDVYTESDSPDGPPTSDHVEFTLPDGTKAWGIPVPADVVDGEPVQKNPPPPPCWDASINNCPVGGALRFVAPEYAMVGVPVTMYAYASWRPDANAPSQPTNGTAVIRVDGEDYSGVEFKDGVAEWRFIPETEGMKEFTASGVLFSGLSGANAYIDSVPARTYVLEYDPAAYAAALKNKRVEVGDTYVVTDPNQARSYLEDRYEWSVSSKSDDVCAVYETKKGAVKAKFNGEGKCTVIWMDKESEEEGKYTFIAKK